MGKKIKVLSAVFGIAGLAWFLVHDGWVAAVNFLIAFLLVTVNFIYLESLTRTIVEKNPEKAKWVALITLVRYPLIALVLYVIVSWRNFQKLPFFVGLSAIVFGLLLSPLAGGGKAENGT